MVVVLSQVPAEGSRLCSIPCSTMHPQQAVTDHLLLWSLCADKWLPFLICEWVSFLNIFRERVGILIASMSGLDYVKSFQWIDFHHHHKKGMKTTRKDSLGPVFSLKGYGRRIVQVRGLHRCISTIEAAMTDCVMWEEYHSCGRERNKVRMRRFIL